MDLIPLLMLKGWLWKHVSALLRERIPFKNDFVRLTRVELNHSSIFLQQLFGSDGHDVIYICMNN